MSKTSDTIDREIPFNQEFSAAFLLSEFRKDIRAISHDHKEEMRSMSNEHRTEMRSMSNEHRTEMRSMRNEMRHLDQKIDSVKSSLTTKFDRYFLAMLSLMVFAIVMPFIKSWLGI